MANEKSEAHMISAAAFVEGGIQDTYDDSCSICLEAFCESDPSTVTSCKHDFHLHCILEWCQRSSNCPMCWQPISLKDPVGQELLEAVEKEKLIRSCPARNATIFYHPALGDFGLPHLHDGVDDAELENRIIQHLAAAAAMGRACRRAQRESSRNLTGVHGHPNFLLFSRHANTSTESLASTSVPHVGAEPHIALTNTSPIQTTMSSESPRHASNYVSVQSRQIPALPSGSVILHVSPGEISSSRRSAACMSPVSQERAEPSDLHSFSESWRSRLNSISMKYKESISKSTQVWKEKLFSRSTSMAEVSSEVRKEVNDGMVSVSRLMERLETRENSRGGSFSTSVNHEVAPPIEPTETRTETPPTGNHGFSANTGSQ